MELKQALLMAERKLSLDSGYAFHSGDKTMADTLDKASSLIRKHIVSLEGEPMTDPSVCIKREESVSQSEIRKFVAAVVAQAGYPMGLGGENPWNEALNEVAERQGFTIADLTPEDLRDNPYLNQPAPQPTHFVPTCAEEAYLMDIEKLEDAAASKSVSQTEVDIDAIDKLMAEDAPEVDHLAEAKAAIIGDGYGTVEPKISVAHAAIAQVEALTRIADLLASVISNYDASNHYIRTQPHG